MGKIIAVTNQKGGVGKTTTSVNLAASLASFGKKILLVDIDPQGNATSGVGIDKNFLETNIYDLLLTDIKVNDVMTSTMMDTLKVIPATIDLAGADIAIGSIKQSREKLLKAKLDEVKNDFDYIIIDCPPSLGLLSMNALGAADSVLIPVQCEFFALEGLTQLLNTIMMARGSFNPALTIEGVLLTMMDRRTNLGLEVSQEIHKNFSGKVYKTIIPRNIKLGEAPSFGKTIIQHDPTSAGAYAYRELAKEVMTQNGK